MRGPVAIEGPLILPGGPHDACQFVGERDGGLVVAAALCGGECPGPQPIEWSATPCGAAAGVEHGARAMDQERAQVYIAAFADPSEAPALARGVLAGGQSEPAGQVAAGAEALDIDNCGPQRGG